MFFFFKKRAKMANIMMMVSFDMKSDVLIFYISARLFENDLEF